MSDSVVLADCDGFGAGFGGVQTSGGVFDGVFDGDGGDFGVEEAGLLGAGGFHVAGSREGVLVLARDVVALRHVLARHAHGHDTIPRILYRGTSQLRPQYRRHGFRLVVARHALHACANTYIYPPYSDGIRDGGDGLQARGTGAVDGVE